MTEYVPVPDDEGMPLGNAIYEMNVSLLANLEELEERDTQLRKRERRWKAGGAIASLAPLVAVGIVMTTHKGHSLRFEEKGAIDIVALVGSSFIGVKGWEVSQKNRHKAQRLAEESALPIARAINSNMTPSWIQRRLAERDKDLRKQKIQMQN